MRRDRLLTVIDLIIGVVHVVAIAIRNRLGAIVTPASDRAPRRPSEGPRDRPGRPARVLLPETARVVLLILIANLVAALIAIVLPLTAVLDAPGLVLSKIIAGCAGAADIRCSRAA